MILLSVNKEFILSDTLVCADFDLTNLLLLHYRDDNGEDPILYACVKSLLIYTNGESKGVRKLAYTMLSDLILRYEYLRSLTLNNFSVFIIITVYRIYFSRIVINTIFNSRFRAFHDRLSLIRAFNSSL